ncbi:MAG TPA: serine/threonine-protein kinase, partial [Kofleriaceae bacterium]|nr:serine/threonine-protein kinase [Kofleriaceae bacterium]
MPPDDDPPSSPTLYDRPSTPAAGPAKLAARFRAVREIARGGMGRVVEAIDIELGRTVAVKQVLSTHPDARRRFEREIAITARLEHPSIVPLYDAGTSLNGDPFYVMRKLTGAPLDHVIRDATTLDRRLLLLPNLLAVADAVAHAHGRGVLHRDLKPSNVLVGDLGDTVVIDWGLAKIVGDPDDPLSNDQPQPGSSLRTVAGAVIGTPGFMAPEQVTGDPVDARSDVYALGACLYYLLAGAPPISGGSETEILTRTVSGDVS